MTQVQEMNVAAEWYYQQDGQPHGPIAQETLQQLLTLRSLAPETLIWREGLSEWLPATSLGFQAPRASPAAVPPAAPPPAAPPPAPPVIASSSSRNVPAPPSSPTTSDDLGPPPPPVVVTTVRATGAIATKSSAVRPKDDLARRRLTLALVASLSALAGIGLGWFGRSLTETTADQWRGTPSQVARLNSTEPPSDSSGMPHSPQAPVDSPTGPSTALPTAPLALSPPVVAPNVLPGVASADGGGLAAPSAPADSAPSPVMPPATNSAPSGTSPAETAAPPTVGPMPSTGPSASAVTSTVPPTSPSTPSPSTPPATSTSFFQELDIERAPQFSILGTTISQDLRYQILSELHVDTPDADGNRSVDQTVIDTKLLRADELSRATFVDSLRELKGQRFRYKVNRLGVVAAMENVVKGGRQAVAVRPPGAQGFAITSVMDPDGWREMAELTFLAPPKDAPTAPWTRGMRHDFGPLGGWYGETQFRPGETRGGSQRIDFGHKLTYQPPGKDAGRLPFTIREADLKPETAGGVAQFDPRTGRITTAQERFVVRGQVNAELLGQVAPIELAESQTLKITITEKNPWK